MNSFFAKRNTPMNASLLLVATLLCVGLRFTAAQIGVCYGQNADNLPSKQEAIELYKSNGITRMRIYDPNEETLQALRGSNIELILGVPNDSLQSLRDAGAATAWVQKYVTPYSSDVKFKYIAVGNEIPPSDGNAGNVLPALQNIQAAIASANLQQIKVSTAIDTSLLGGNSYPPSTGVYNDNAKPFIEPIISFLNSNGAPLLANIYPYFAYKDQQSIPLEYALFTQQSENDAGYKNLFDALLDALYAANEKIGAPNLKIVVSESGWPSEGGVASTVENAGTYYRNLIDHVKGGSKKSNGPIETYLFAMFDEKDKDGEETERHFGLFRPDKSPKYQLGFN